MKCAKCNSEWASPPGKSLAACPFCNEPTQTPSDISRDNVIKTIVFQYGESILLDSKLYSMIADLLQNQDSKTLKRLRLAINEGVPQKMYSLKPVDEQERTSKLTAMMVALKDTYGMACEIACEIVNWFGDALNYKAITPLLTPIIQATTPFTHMQTIQKLDKDLMEQKREKSIRHLHNSPPNPRDLSYAMKLVNQLCEKMTQTFPPDLAECFFTPAPQIGSIIPFGGYDWRVLAVENNKALLISEKILEKHPYNVEQKDITWENCTLRKYLNNNFLNKLCETKTAVVETRNSNPNNPWYGTTGGNATTDSVFLLSLDEVVCYLGDSGDLKNKRRKNYKGSITSDGHYLDDLYNDARVAKDSNDEACWWWLRSSGYQKNSVVVVGYGGDIGVGAGAYGGNITGIGGVRPALWLRL